MAAANARIDRIDKLSVAIDYMNQAVEHLNSATALGVVDNAPSVALVGEAVATLTAEMESILDAPEPEPVANVPAGAALGAVGDDQLTAVVTAALAAAKAAGAADSTTYVMAALKGLNAGGPAANVPADAAVDTPMSDLTDAVVDTSVDTPASSAKPPATVDLSDVLIPGDHGGGVRDASAAAAASDTDAVLADTLSMLTAINTSASTSIDVMPTYEDLNSSWVEASGVWPILYVCNGHDGCIYSLSCDGRSWKLTATSRDGGQEVVVGSSDVDYIPGATDALVPLGPWILRYSSDAATTLYEIRFNRAS